MKERSQQIKDFLLMTAGTVIMVAGIYFFKYPNNFSTGGVSGIAVIASHYLPGLTPGTVAAFLNTALLVLGYACLGKGFGFKTAYVTVLQSVLLRGLEIVLPMKGPMTDEPMLELAFAVALPALGSAILFNIGASSGGTDILAMLMKKVSTMNIGRALMLSDCLITLMACVAFGMKTGLYSILGLALKSVMVDVALESFNTNKCFHIITAHPAAAEEFVTQVLHRGATRIHGEGVYTHEGREVILTVVSRHQAVLLRRYIHQHDPEAFLLITNTGEIIGKGFRRIDD